MIYYSIIIEVKMSVKIVYFVHGTTYDKAENKFGGKYGIKV